MTSYIYVVRAAYSEGEYEYTQDHFPTLGEAREFARTVATFGEEATISRVMIEGEPTRMICHLIKYGVDRVPEGVEERVQVEWRALEAHRPTHSLLFPEGAYGTEVRQLDSETAK